VSKLGFVTRLAAFGWRHKQLPAGHVLPAPQFRQLDPQWVGSLVLTHDDPPQVLVPAGQAQVPPWQVVPPLQVWQVLPQVPLAQAHAFVVLLQTLLGPH